MFMQGLPDVDLATTIIEGSRIQGQVTGSEYWQDSQESTKEIQLREYMRESKVYIPKTWNVPE